MLCFQNAAEKLPFFIPSWTLMYVINAFVVVWVLVVGFGFGGWASMANFIKQVDTFGLFAKCYQCPPHKTPASNQTLHHWKLYICSFAWYIEGHISIFPIVYFPYILVQSSYIHIYIMLMLMFPCVARQHCYISSLLNHFG